MQFICLPLVPAAARPSLPVEALLLPSPVVASMVGTSKTFLAGEAVNGVPQNKFLQVVLVSPQRTRTGFIHHDENEIPEVKAGSDASEDRTRSGRWARANFKIVVSYHGASFDGWQKQPDLNTVQGLVEKSLGSFQFKLISLHLFIEN